jgi:hypothetical protein
MNRFMSLTLVFLSLSFSRASFAETLSAQIFAKPESAKEVLYNLAVETSPEKVTLSYRDLTGNVLVEESGELSGVDIKSHSVKQNQLNTSARIERQGDKVIFTKTVDGKTSTKSENYKGSLVVASNFQRFIASKWQELKNNETVEFRFGVWDRQETVGFSLKKVSESASPAYSMTLKMKPANFVIAALVDPLLLTFEESPSIKLRTLVGRIPVKAKEGDKFKDQDARVVYQ